jgi:hypothetical protein
METSLKISLNLRLASAELLVKMNFANLCWIFFVFVVLFGKMEAAGLRHQVRIEFLII